MKSECSIKHNIPSIIKAIQQEDDADLISNYENMMVSMYASVLLLIASIANFVVRYIIQSEDLKTSLFNSVFFLLIGLAFEISVRVRLKSQLVTIIISALSFITLMFICVSFYDIIGPAVWTVAFIQLLLAMIRITKHMLHFLAVAIFLSNVYIFYHSFYSSAFNMDTLYYIVQVVLFVFMSIIAIAVHKVSTSRYNTIKEKCSEVVQKNEEINTLFEEIVASEEKIRNIANQDHLTGLPNRRFLSEKLNNSIYSSSRVSKMLTIMFLDLDNFKMINDSMGHATGDKLLLEVSRRLINILSKNAIVARIGGDEFIILIEDIKDFDMVNMLTMKVLNSFNKAFSLNDMDVFITTSIGVAVYPRDGQDAETLIKNADIAMYKAKRKGRNQFAVCTEGMKVEVVENMKLSNDLYKAIELRELELYYQPQVNTSSNKIIGVEALLRWNHPELGMILPEKFIPIAEQTGLIISIGEWVIRTACKQNKKWHIAGLPKIPVAVNLSVRQFQDTNIIKQVQDILKETDLDPHFLELEITESIAMKEACHVVEILSAFKSMGIGISIDDFGTEYSSLNYLKLLPVDKIKIAMPFIHGIDVSNEDESITMAIIILAKNLGLRVIAEGVETETQLSFLTQRLCDEVQGFYYYRPMPANEFEKLLGNNYETI